MRSIPNHHNYIKTLSCSGWFSQTSFLSVLVDHGRCVTAIILKCRLYCSNRLLSALSASVSLHAQEFLFFCLLPPLSFAFVTICRGMVDCVVWGRGSVRRAAEETGHRSPPCGDSSLSALIETYCHSDKHICMESVLWGFLWMEGVREEVCC